MGRWRLDPRDVISGYASGQTPHTSMEELPEHADVREYTIWLEHRPTGKRVEGRIPRGRYTTKELELLEIEVRKGLFAELELLVGRHLRKSDV